MVVDIDGGTNAVGALADGGSLVLSGGSLEIAGTSEASTVASLTLTGGTLTGAGTLDVSSSLAWKGGTMSGSGQTVLKVGATGSIDPGSGNAVALTERDLVNQGTLTWVSGSVAGRSSAELDNAGTLNANADVPPSEISSHGLLNSDGSGVWLHNTGSLKKAAGTQFTQIGFQLDNEGSVEAQSGQLILAGGGHGSTAATGSWQAAEDASVAFYPGSYLLRSNVHMAGTIYLAGGSIKAGNIQGTRAHLVLWSGNSTLELTDSSTASHVKELTQQSAAGTTTLTGAGTLNVSTSLSWNGGSMTGSGKTTTTRSRAGLSAGTPPASLGAA